MPGKIILLVEDNADDVALTERMLTKGNITNDLIVARDGAEALDYLFGVGAYAHRLVSDVPQVIVLDLKLPKVSGIEVLKRVRADERLQYVPIVVLTASDDERDVVESYELGANSYVRKPINLDEFAGAARDLGLYWLLINEPPPMAHHVAGG